MDRLNVTLDWDNNIATIKEYLTGDRKPIFTHVVQDQRDLRGALLNRLEELLLVETVPLDEAVNARELTVEHDPLSLLDGVEGETPAAELAEEIPAGGKDKFDNPSSPSLLESLKDGATKILGIDKASPRRVPAPPLNVKDIQE